MNHEPYREWLVLDLYGELAEEDALVLAAHLESCSPCRELRDTLAGDLGVLARHVRESREFEDALALTTEDLEAIERDGARTASLAKTALAFLAGPLCAWWLVARGTAEEDGPAIEPPPPTCPTFERNERPPRATTSGPISQLRFRR